MIAGCQVHMVEGDLTYICDRNEVLMEERYKWLVSSLLGLVATFTHKYGLMIVLVAIAIVFDFATGIIKANIEGNVNSQKGTKGFFKKIALLVCLFFGFFLDYAIPYMCEKISIDISFAMPFGLIICFYIVLNECISICENLYACNPDIMPRWIVNILLTAKAKLEDGEQDAKNIK